MSIKIGKYSFEGPYDISGYSLEDCSGIYAVLCKKDNKYNVIDVGESANVKTRIQNHDRKDCWNRHCHSNTEVAVHYTPHLQQHGRMSIEQEIRSEYDPPCGKR